MAEELLGGFVGFLALLGAVALVLALVRSMGRLVLGAAEEAAASGMADASARRGDLTSLAEARAAQRVARSGRRRSVVASVLYGLWIVAPLALGGVREVWALAAPLWLVPRAVGNGSRGSDGGHG